jgi:pimeloyl-ACP methyl ester carboxylesterase
MSLSLSSLTRLLALDRPSPPSSSSPSSPHSLTHSLPLLAYGAASLYLLLELLSYSSWKKRVQRISASPVSPLSQQYPLVRYQRFFRQQMFLQRHPRDIVEAMFQAPLERVSSERVRHWLCFYLTMREMESFPGERYPEEVVHEADEVLQHMQREGGFTLHSDPATAWLPLEVHTECTLPRSDVVDFVRVGRGSINAFYKPIPVRVLMLCMRCYAEREMRQMGFTRTVGAGSIVYWRRPQRTKRDDSRAIRPLFFLHGLGFGLVPYVHFIHSLLDDRRDMVVPEWPNISLGWSDNCREDSLTPKEYADSLFKCIKTLHNSDGSMATCIDTVGHSWGTVVTHFYMAHRPSLLVRRVYIDSLAFGASFHRWSTFSHEYCLRSWSDLFAIRHKIGYFETFGMWAVKGDINVQQLGKRAVHFAQILYSAVLENIDHNCLFVLSGQDPIIPAYDVIDHVEKNETCETVIDHEWSHGEFLFGPDPGNIWQRIADWVSPREQGVLRRVKSDPSFRGHLFGSAS